MSTNQSAEVPGDTDDLDAFTASVFGGPKTEVKEDVTKQASADEANTEVDDESTEDTAEESDSHVEDDDDAADELDPGDESDESEDDGKAKPEPKKNRVQERIDELTAARKEAERETEKLRQELARERAGKQQEAEKAKPSVQVPVASDIALPTPDDKDETGNEKYPLGELDSAFIRDLTRATIRAENARARIEEQERANAAQAEAAQRELQTEWATKVETAKKALPDFPDTVKVLQDTFATLEPNYGNYLSGVVMSMEYGPEVLYYLSNNLPEARKIVDSGAAKATIALGRLEAQFAAKPAKEKAPVKVTKIAEPPKTVRGVGGKFSVSADTDDLDAFEKTFFQRK